jgi:hypothetical protein
MHRAWPNGRFSCATLEAGTGPAIYRSRRFVRMAIIRCLVRGAIFFPVGDELMFLKGCRRRRSSSRGSSPNVSDADCGLVVLDCGVEEIATEFLHHPVAVVQAGGTGVSCVGTRYMYVIDSWLTG